MKRYDIYNHPIARIGFEQKEDPNGEWVKYEDIEKELHDLRQVAQENADWFDQLKIDYDKLEEENKKLKDALEIAINTLDGVEVFVKSREKINKPYGHNWFDDHVELCKKVLEWGNNK